MRKANEALELASHTHSETVRVPLRRECGDAMSHENPESSWVLSENARFAVIDVVAGDARSHVLARNPRHAWTDERDRRAP